MPDGPSEKDIVLDLAALVKDSLAQYGVSSELSRTEDEYLDAQSRDSLAVDSAAKAIMVDTRKSRAFRFLCQHVRVAVSKRDVSTAPESLLCL